MEIRQKINQIIPVLFAVFVLTGCQAFSDHPKEQEILSSLGVYDTEVTSDEVVQVENTSASACTALKEVVAETSVLGQSLTSVSGFGIGGTAIVESTQENNATIEISSAEDVYKLKFTLHKDDSTLTVCEASLTKAGKTYSILEGNITVNSFGNEKLPVHAGAYQLVFTESKKGATSAMAAMLSVSTAAVSNPEIGISSVGVGKIVVSGTYYIDTSSSTESN